MNDPAAPVEEDEPDSGDASRESADEDASLKERFSEYEERLETKYEEDQTRRSESLPIDVAWRALLPGAVFLAVGAMILQFLIVSFFSRYIEDKTQTYGAIGASIAILLWTYLLGRLIVTSAFLNAERWRRSRLDA